MRAKKIYEAFNVLKGPSTEDLEKERVRRIEEFKKIKSVIKNWFKPKLVKEDTDEIFSFVLENYNGELFLIKISYNVEDPLRYEIKKYNLDSKPKKESKYSIRREELPIFITSIVEDKLYDSVNEGFNVLKGPDEEKVKKEVEKIIKNSKEEKIEDVEDFLKFILDHDDWEPYMADLPVPNPKVLKQLKDKNLREKIREELAPNIKKDLFDISDIEVYYKL